MIADDDRSMAKTLCAILRRQGWQAVEVHDGRAAVAAADATRFDVVLMDVKMPGLNGVEAFRAIRQSQPHTPVILMTAYAAPELLADAEREGVLRILPKPIPWGTLTDLLSKLRELGDSVLVVDDDPEFLATLADLLTASGRRVQYATTLAEAVALLETRAHHVVVLDVVLAGIEPRASLIAIRELSPAAVLILCGGQAALLDRTVSELPPDWIYAALTKPFHPAHLLQLLDGVHNS